MKAFHRTRCAALIWIIGNEENYLEGSDTFEGGEGL
jgi:hypothetical protein